MAASFKLTRITALPDGESVFVDGAEAAIPTTTVSPIGMASALMGATGLCESLAWVKLSTNFGN
jgi:hypothetical protein